MIRFLLCGLLALGLGLTFVPVSAQAASFNPSHLIDNDEFLAVDAISVSRIQAFLASHGSVLANYSEGGRSAAQIIYDAAHGYGDASNQGGVPLNGILITSATGTVNPAVLLVTLQKEQSLVTRTTAGQNVLNAAMGYACPDSGGCNPNYVGFTKQVENAAWQLRYNYERAQGYGFSDYQVGQSFCFADWNGTNCGSYGNRATASLYRYTPHVYNGNFNFWNLYQEWFSQIDLVTTTLSIDTHGGIVGTQTRADLHLRYDSDAGHSVAIAISARRKDPNGIYSQNYDFGSSGPFLMTAGSTWRLDLRRFLPAGDYKIYGAYYFRDEWHPLTDVAKTFTIRTPSITASYSPSAHYNNGTVSIPVTFTNNEPFRIYTSGFGLAARKNGGNVDFPTQSPGYLDPGQSRTIILTRSLADGVVQVFPIVRIDSPDWLPLGVAKSFNVWPDQVYQLRFNQVTVDQSPAFYNDPIDVRFTITNPTSSTITIPKLRVAGRRLGAPNYDFGLAEHVVVPANATIPIHFRTVLGKSNQFQLWPIYQGADGHWVAMKPSAGTPLPEQVMVY